MEGRMAEAAHEQAIEDRRSGRADRIENNRVAERIAMRLVVEALTHSAPKARTPEAEGRHVNALRAAKRMLADREGR